MSAFVTPTKMKEVEMAKQVRQIVGVVKKYFAQGTLRHRVIGMDCVLAPSLFGRGEVLAVCFRSRAVLHASECLQTSRRHSLPGVSPPTCELHCTEPLNRCQGFSGPLRVTTR